jgi:predicted dehydrogenase
MSQVSRRTFLKHSVALSTAATVIGAPALHAKTNANERMGVAIVGLNTRGTVHCNAFIDDPRTELRYVVDVDEKTGQTRAAQVAEKQGRKPVYVRDMRDAFDDDSVDIVTAAMPNHWHALCGVWAMQADKDTYIEKPISHNIAEGSALIAAASKYDRICQVGTQRRSNPAAIDAVQFMRDGGIGEVNFARGVCYKRRKSIGSLGDYPIPPEVDFNLWSGPAQYTDPKVTRERFHYDWHWQRAYGNGDLGNQGPHHTDLCRWGLGIDTHPNSVLTYGGRVGYQAERGDPNYVDAGDTANTEISVYDYGDKCIVFETRGLSVDNSDDEVINRLFRSTEGNKMGEVFYGSEGYVVELTETHFVAYDKDFQVIKEFIGGGNHFENFIDACVSRNPKDLNADVREGHLSAAISHLGNIAYEIGENNEVSVDELQTALSSVKSLDDNDATLERTLRHLTDNGVDLNKYPLKMSSVLEFDPKQELFPESPEATALVTRDYRDGFVCPVAKDV